MPRIEINSDTCKGCELCVGVCPHNLIAMSQEINKKGVNYAVYTEKNECTGCTLCAVMCPDLCIEVFKTKKG